jgi:GNAT superfamily N-acetyltransferase/rRNA-processing protein FCF1
VTAHSQIKIQDIDEKSPHLTTVKALWRANSKTLGDFTNGAFADYAARRQILVALDSHAQCIGYVLYRCSYERITIAHLCIDSSARSQGVARLLVDYLKQITQDQYQGIGLYCRRDYQLENFWSNLGFVYKYDKPGRSKDKKLLAFWWLDHGHPNLFSNTLVQKLQSKLCVVIDTNIFLDLYAQENLDVQESVFSFPDWIEPELEICITEEIFNKINLIIDDNDRKTQMEFAKKFTCLPCPNQILDNVVKVLQNFLTENPTDIDGLTQRHLARTIASDATVFITKEERLLKIADKLYENFKLSIIHPNDLLIQIDELGRKPDYQPVRLAGTLLEQIPIQKGQEDFLSNYFSCSKQNETKTEFQQQLRRFLANTEKFECFLIQEGENQPLALVVYGRHKKHELEIPILRVAENSLSATLARHLIFQAILRSSREQREFTRITDSYLEEIISTAIHEDDFVRVNGGWLKANLAVAETASELSLRLTTLGSTLGEEYNFCLQLADSLKEENLIRNAQGAANIERFLFPAKIIDADIPTFIVPIQPRWAIDLFDEGLANQTLFGAKRELAFNREAVYYKSIINSGGLKKAPCRILWYVSQDEHDYYYGVGAVRACSFVDEIVIGKPKELYQRFQRLGVYKLDDLLNVNANNGNIMAIRFSNTELFTHFIDLKNIQKILKKSLSPQSPYKIDNNAFKTIYNLGIII